MARDLAKTHKEWERPLTELEDNIAKLRDLARRENDPTKRSDLEAKADKYQTQCDRYVKLMYANLGDWEKVLIARAEKRPYTLDYVQSIFTGFIELQGTAEGHAFRRDELDALLGLADKGVAELVALQRAALTQP